MTAELSQDVADLGADVSSLVADPDSTTRRDAFKAHLTSLSGHLKDVSDLLDMLDKPPVTVSADVRNQLRPTIGSLRGLLTDLAAYVGKFLRALKLRDELTLRFDWSPQLKPVSVFIPRNETEKRDAKLVIAVEAHAKSRVRSAPTIDVSARLTDFTVELIHGFEGFLRLSFNRLEFLAPAGKKPDVNVDFAYFPFVRLALARYQHFAIDADHKLSTIVPLDFAQLAPDRTLKVDWVDEADTLLDLSLSGVGPDGPTPNSVEVTISWSLYAKQDIEREFDDAFVLAYYKHKQQDGEMHGATYRRSTHLFIFSRRQSAPISRSH